MKMKWTLLLAGGLSGIVLLTAGLARSADLQPMIVKNLTGDLNIHQDVPCGDDVDVTVPVTQGRLELTPAEGIDDPATGGKRFTMTRASMSFAGFSVHRDCAGFGETRDYAAVGVDLARAVTFTAPPAATGVYAMTIPKADFLISEAAIVNGGPEWSYMKPGSDVTGTIDFTSQTFTMKVVVNTSVHFEAGCLGDLCIIKEDDAGTLTATIAGTIALPDTDGDGIPDGRDNCPFVPNPDQKPVPTPTITPPADITVSSCADHKIGSASAADICHAGPVTVTSKAPTTFVVGKNVVTWNAQDAAGHVATATQIVTVVDTTAPIFTFVPADIAVNTCGPVALGLPKAMDDCAGPVTFKNNAPPTFGVGSTVVKWIATDASGNQSVETQTVTVTDTVPPTVSCVPAGPPGGTFRASASDACDTPIIRLGTFVLANGERIKINETGHSGVTFVGFVGPDHIRHFHVGKGEGVIMATDASGNVASASCR